MAAESADLESEDRDARREQLDALQIAKLRRQVDGRASAAPD